ncbi:MULTISPECIES: hypothetical protein [Moorena]|uniref:Uncharacterized protein n=2 Tax=Moorena producens TaxID=1155739 RepID=A0A1D9G888_MOOP1|nr:MULTISPECIES: hypothetical protein [Moorena]NEQ15204.1 hypothetical protein [Moorena sp. SIO3E2]NES82223.1 hypothetical protein [Moorena sp. SIO2B7]AOY83813.1 hypothetical protein BJP36_31735 [Moorena producens JHB]EGJ34786.1 hypothetical protein LYNGBM3L_12360 [Moorena producens 3L]NEP33004.1 hypothetical protein [Moorena sp. SIO3B2]
MKLPKQTAPIQRKVSGTTLSLNNGVNGVEASDTIDDVLRVTEAVAPIVTPVLTAAIGSLI